MYPVQLHLAQCSDQPLCRGSPGHVLMNVKRAQMTNGGSNWNIPKLTENILIMAEYSDLSGRGKNCVSPNLEQSAIHHYYREMKTVT